MTDSENTQLAGIKKDRSPAFPFISLRIAVERLAAFEATFGRHPAPADKVGLAWKMKDKSSQAFQTLAALKSYGLVEYQGSGPERKAFLTSDGRNYLRAQQEPVKAEILQRCATRPKAINMYWSMWGADRPPDPVCLDVLVIQGGYTPSAAATFLRVYDDTVKFAGLAQTDSVEPSAAPEVGESEASETQARPGSPSAEGNAISRMDQTPIGTRRDTFSLDEGLVVLQWPEKLSAASYEDFESWIGIVLRKIKRSIQES